MTIESNLWYPPAAPSAVDDEFNDAVATAADWDLSYTPVGTTIDPLATFATAGAIRESINGIRRSWYLVQPPTESVNRYISRAPSPGVELADGTYWCRAKTMYAFNSISDNSQVYLTLAATSGGDPDNNNDGYTIYLTENDAANLKVRALGFSGGVQQLSVNMSNLNGFGLHWEYLAIIKDGSDYHLFIGAGGGNWTWIATDTYPGAAVIDRVGLGFVSVNGSSPGNIIYGFDFMRFRSDGQLP